MKKQFHKPHEIELREITNTEINTFANEGDYSCLLEKAKEAWKVASSTPDKFKVLAKLLGLE